MSNALTTASVLAFERKLDPSDALFFSGNWDDRGNSDSWSPVEIREKAVRGTISNRLKTKDPDPAKLDAAIENPNLQTVDVATLPADADTLKARFTLRVLSGVGDPSACNSAAYRDKLLETVRGYVDGIGLGELAFRYAANLANGRFLWRNRIGAEEITIQVAHIKDGVATSEWNFDALSHNMRELTAPDNEKGKLQELAKLIEQGLSGHEHVLLRITAFVRVGAGQEVFPSQELILDRGRGDKSKTLYQVGDIAAMHSQKIGNALRTIDTW
ncbi:MAG: type I-F CRISPR-associated protein Csy3, partial [Wenzhouxiangella sp.]